MTARIIFPARRAVEHATTIPGLVPVRLFPVLWPLWSADTTAIVCDEQEYDLIDRFLMRAVVDAQLTRLDDLVAFLGLPELVARRCITYLATIQHVRFDGAYVSVTDLGVASVRAGVRYEWKQSRQKLLVERYTSAPLPRSHYGGGISILSEATVDRERVTDGSRFTALFSLSQFQNSAVEHLEHRQDRPEFNLPRQLRDLRVVGNQQVWLPAYLVETESHGLLAYTAAAPERDTFLEQICRTVSAISDQVSAEHRVEPRALWTEWLANAQHGVGTLRRLPSGVWRATFSASAFADGKHPVSRVGSFHLHRNHFIQLWCEDSELRKTALFDRAFGLVRLPEVDIVDDFERRLAAIAKQLELPAPDIERVRRRATEARRYDVIARLDIMRA